MADRTHHDHDDHGDHDGAGEAMTAHDLRPLIAGKYAIEWEVDQGAMGRVFAATHVGLERAVAIKVMSESGSGFRERFLLEARALASLNHRNIVTIYDSGEMADGLVFIVMEYLRGQTIADALKRERRFDVVRTLHVAVQAARGLRAAHRQGIVHRDLKPSNMFLVEDEDDGEIVKIFDFGIAKTLPRAGEHVVTRDGLIVGTPAYMAPEQVDGRPVDARSDLYALGVVLYQLLTGRTPFVGSSQVELMMSHLRKQPPGLRTLQPTVPTPVEDLVMRLLRKDPNERYRDADALLPALKELLVVFGGEAFRGQSTDVFGADTPLPPPTRVPERAPAPRTSRWPPLPSGLVTLEPLPRTESPSPRTPWLLPNAGAFFTADDPRAPRTDDTEQLPPFVPVVMGALVHPEQHFTQAFVYARARRQRAWAALGGAAAAAAVIAGLALFGDAVASAMASRVAQRPVQVDLFERDAPHRE